MDKYWISCTRFCVLLYIFLANLSKGNGSVEFELNQANFDSIISQHPFILVQFHAPTDGFCKAFAPEWVNVRTRLIKDDANIKLGKVDCSVETELKEKYQARGLPKIKLFRDAVPVDYKGELRAEPLLVWLREKTGPIAKALDSVEMLNEFVASAEVVVVGFFPGGKLDDIEPFISAARRFADQKFGLVLDRAIAEQFHIEGSGVVMFKKFDNPQIVYKGDIEDSALATWIKNYSLRQIVEFQSGMSLHAGEIKKLCILFESNKTKPDVELLDAFRAASETFRGSVTFVRINAGIDGATTALHFYGIRRANLPEVLFVNFEHGFSNLEKYKPEGKLRTSVQISSFISDALQNKIKQFYKSEDVPANWNKYEVKVLVRDNFKQVAMDTTKNVFVDFYSPWCSHCKQLDPVWQDLAEDFLHRKDVVIAKIDATANDFEDIRIRSYPTLKLFKAGSNQVIDYRGERTIAKLSEFLNSEVKSTHEEL